MSKTTLEAPSGTAFTLVDEVQVRYRRKRKWDVKLAEIKESLLNLPELKFPAGKVARVDFSNEADQKSFGSALRLALKDWDISERFKVGLSQEGTAVVIKNRK